MIKSLYIDNFKALNHFKICLNPFTVLIGNNAAGKSTVLQAIAFLKYCCASSVDAFLDERGLSAEDLCSKLQGRNVITISSELALEHFPKLSWKLELLRSGDHFELQQEEITAGGKVLLSYGGEKPFRLNAQSGEHDSLMLGSFSSSMVRFIDIARQAEQYPELCAIKNFFNGLETLDLLSPANMKKNSQGTAESIGPGGEKLSSFINKLSDADRKKLAEDVNSFLEFFSSVTPRTKQFGWVYLETQETHGKKQIEISAPNVSDGTVRIIALCALQFLKNQGCAILLDEIEDGVNNEHLELLVKMLRNISEEKHIQIIATTHSPALLDFWIDKPPIDADELPENNMESIVFLSRNAMGEAEAEDFLHSPVVRERLAFMYPGEVIQSMTNRQLRESLSKEHVK